jgi:hypothetical protein
LITLRSPLLPVGKSKSTCDEAWVPRGDLKEPQSQKFGSFRKDKEILQALLTEAPNQRERQRLNRLQCEHAGAWVSAVPSTLDGGDTVMRSRNFQVASLLRLGLPVLMEETRCSLCVQTMDNFGDHAACCTKNADLIHRHNRLRNLLDTICTEGGLAPVMEKKGILGDSDKPGRRPGDVTVPLWRSGRGLAMDLAVTCPLAASNLSRAEPCEHYKPRSTTTTMKISRAPSSSLLRWFSSPLAVSTRRVSQFFVNCFALLPSAKAPNSVFTVVVLGPAFPVTFNPQ